MATSLSNAPTSSARTWRLKALTPIWTGDANGAGKRLILTGLLGSLRWWFEVLVRGLCGSACDPTQTNRCPSPQVKGPTQPQHHCVVCELFGCTGWARKFRFQAFDINGNICQEQITKNQDFELRFTPLRPIGVEEWTLLEMTVRLIAEHGAIGGRTVYKPSNERTRAGVEHHRDYGLVKLEQAPNVSKEIGLKTLEDYVHSARWRKVDQNAFAWASLGNFWCVRQRYLARQNSSASTFNRALCRNERKGRSDELLGSGAAGKWLAGGRRESKKIFSFKEPAEARRTFGFVKPGTVSFDQMKDRLRRIWPSLNDTDFAAGTPIIEALFKTETRRER